MHPRRAANRWRTARSKYRALVWPIALHPEPLNQRDAATESADTFCLLMQSALGARRCALRSLGSPPALLRPSSRAPPALLPRSSFAALVVQRSAWRGGHGEYKNPTRQMIKAAPSYSRLRIPLRTGFLLSLQSSNVFRREASVNGPTGGREARGAGVSPDSPNSRATVLSLGRSTRSKRGSINGSSQFIISKAFLLRRRA
jgi:hypothetical protein